MEKLELKNRKNQRIVGVLEKPIGTIKGTCIVQHGWGGNRNRPTIQAIKNGFLKSGFQTYNFDATNSFGESDGDYEKSTLGLHWEDLEDVVKWAQKQTWFTSPLALAGHSKGGYAVVRYTEEHPEEVSFLVPVGPVVSGDLSFKAEIKHNATEFYQWQKDGIKIGIDKTGRKKVKHWFQMEERLQHNLLPNVNKITIPTLLIAGSKDVLCLEQTQILFKALPNGNKELKLIENAPHSFYEATYLEECETSITNWLNKVMQ